MRIYEVTHGASKHPLYKVWLGIRSRCYNIENGAYPDYGGRGIKMCDRWLESPLNFIADMAPRPESPGDGRSIWTVERKDNNGDYDPDNCIWALMETQNLNRRSNVIIEFNGKRQTATEWAKEIGCPPVRIHLRLGRYKMPIPLVLYPGRINRMNRHKIELELGLPVSATAPCIFSRRGKSPDPNSEEALQWSKTNG